MLKENIDKINQQKSNFWEWFSLLLDMAVPFGTIKSHDFNNLCQMLKAGCYSNMLEDLQNQDHKN